MSQALQSLLDLLDLEQIEEDIFRGQSRSAVVPRVFGGQVAAQALVAAGRTVPEDRLAHSLHAYFLRTGDPGAPIVYTVDRIRDGRSFTTRRVVAVQHGQPIFHLSASFQTYEEGLEHQAPMPAAPGPGDAAHRRGAAARYAHLFPTRPSSSGCWRRGPRSTCATSTTRRTARVGEPREPRSQVWFRTNGKLDRRPAAARLPRHLRLRHDAARLGAARARARRLGGRRRGRAPRLDHAMWFHRPFRADEWLLYDQESPVRVRRPGPRPGPDLHAGRAARRSR